MTTLLVAVAVLGLFAGLSFGGWRIHRRKAHHVMARMAAQLQIAAQEIGAALLPALRDTAAAFDQFAKAWKR